MTRIIDLEPTQLWKHFDALRQIPRCSKNEKAAGEYIKEFAKNRGYHCRQDDAGNIVVQVPATQGHDNKPGIVLQGHLDMVCEKNSDKSFDFEKDAIQAQIDGDQRGD